MIRDIRTSKLQAPRAPAAQTRPIANPATKAQPASGVSAPLAEHGFSAKHAALIHEAIQLAQFEWMDGKGFIAMRTESLEVRFRRGGLEDAEPWAVMGFPIYDMNLEGSVEVCLHFLAESFTMAHVLDYQYQIGINMETENLEFLLHLPLNDVSPLQLSQVVSGFIDALQKTIDAELNRLMDSLGEQTTQ